MKESDLSAAVTAVIDAAVIEAQRQARRLAASSDAAGLPPVLVGREDLLGLHLQSRAGLDVTREVVLQRRQGATWQQIGQATGMTRQSAHERWAASVHAILDRHGTGELSHLADQDLP